MPKYKIAAFLMLFSGVSHPSQLLIFGTDDPNLVQSSLAGMIFLLVGGLLLTGKRWALWIGAVLPLLMGVGATIRIFTIDVTPMSYMHTAIDFVVVYLCAYHLFITEKDAAR